MSTGLKTGVLASVFLASALGVSAPTVAESGYPGYDVTGWVGICVTAGTPPATIARLEAETGKAGRQ